MPNAMLSPTHILPPYASHPLVWKRSVLQCDEDKIRISPARVAKGYFPDKFHPKAAPETIPRKHRRPLIAPLRLHSLFPKNLRPANNLFPLHGRSVVGCYRFEKAGRCCLSLYYRPSKWQNYAPFGGRGPYFRVAGLFIHRFGIGQRPRAKYQAGCFSCFHL